MIHVSIIAGHPLTFPIGFGLAGLILALMLWASIPGTTTSRQRIINLIAGSFGGLLLTIPIIVFDSKVHVVDHPDWYREISEYLLLILASAFAIGSLSAILLFRRISDH